MSYVKYGVIPFFVLVCGAGQIEKKSKMITSRYVGPAGPAGPACLGLPRCMSDGRYAFKGLEIGTP